MTSCNTIYSIKGIYITALPFHCSLSLSVPAVPQGVTASSNGSTGVVMTWREPAVFYREEL